MSTESQTSKKIVQRLETVLNNRGSDGLSKVFKQDLVVRLSGGREEYNGLGEFEAYLEQVEKAFPDLRLSFEEMVSGDSMIAVQYTGTATHKGEYHGIKPTNKEIRLSGMRILRIEDGKIVEVWGHQDDLGVLAQLGVLELPAE